VSFLIGLDIGTTNLKAVVYDVARRSQTVYSCPTRTRYPRPGWAEYDPGEMWKDVAGILRDGIRTLPDPAAIRGIAVASMGEAGLLVDLRGTPLTPIIAWFDDRTEPQVRWWGQKVGEETVYEITGQPLHPSFGINKLMWLRDNEPEAYRRAAHWLSVSDWITYRLSGVVATDYSIASRTMAFAIETHAWSGLLLEKAGIDPRLMPPAWCGGTLVGQVTPRAAEQSRLPAGVPVVTGGHDHICASLAAGACTPGSLMDSTGTSESLILTSDHVEHRPEMRRQKLAQECHVVDGRYAILAGFQVAGFAIEWVNRLLEHGECLPDLGLEEAARVPPGAEGLFFMPHLRGSGSPTLDPDCRGAIVGIGPAHQKAHLLRAAIEGVCYELLSNIIAIESTVGIPIEKVYAVGKATQSPLWLQIKADVSGRRIVAPEISEMTGLGAALLAGLGAGVFGTPEEAVRSLGTVHREVLPEEKRAGFYRQQYDRVYNKIYPALREVHKGMAECSRAAENA
jgi:xylulokinase